MDFFNPTGWLDNLFGGWIVGIANFAADVVKNTFNMDSVDALGNETTADLAVATDVGNIVLVLAIPLTIAAVIWQVMRSSAEGKASGILRAIAGGVGVVVVSRIVFWYGPVVITGFDELTRILIDTFNESPGGITESILSQLNFRQNEDGLWEQDGGGGLWAAPNWMGVQVASIGTGMLIPLIFFICLGASAMILMVMLSFRRWALIIMIGLAPLALMFLPTEKASKAVALKWLQIVAALLAAKPLAAIIIAITAKMIASSGELGMLMFVVAIVAFGVAGLAPLIAMKFFGFLGAEMGHAYAQASGEGALAQGGQKALSTASSANMLARSGKGGGGGGDKAEVIASTTSNTSAASTVTGEPVSTVAMAGVQAVKAAGKKAGEAVGTAADPTPQAGGSGGGGASTPAPAPMEAHRKPDEAGTV